MMYLDLAELDEVFAGRWFWSARRAAPARFRQSDHLAQTAEPLDVAVRNLVESRTGRRPAGPIRLLTQLRYFGYLMNPIGLFYCFDARGEQVETVVAEVNNTPWGERHYYILDSSCASGDQAARERNDAPLPSNDDATRHLRFRHPKEFHVSPFMAMDMEYVWRLSHPDEALDVHIDSFRHGEKLFDSSLSLKRSEITGWRLTRLWAQYPWMTGKIVSAIYWQALRLWLKKASFFPHSQQTTQPQVTVP